MKKNNSSPTVDYPTLDGIPVSIRNDYLFKKIFGSEDSKSAVAHLIHLTTGIRKEDVIDLTISDPHLPFRNIRDKRGILDIHIKLKDGKRVNIEMQNHWHPFYPERAIYYWSFMYQETSLAGNSYNRLSKCIGIHLSNETFRLNEKLQSTYTIREEDGSILSDVLELHFFDLTRLPEETKDLLQSEISELERWLLFIRTNSQAVRNVLSEGDELMSECNEKVKSVFYTPSEREIYIREHIAEMDHYSIMQEKFESGKMEGMEEGRVEGREETTIKIARALLQNGVDMEIVQKSTGLDREQLETLE
ncbi:MAG TPA: Rpn family recombination-promoting nuclease/putative transposase [Clostridiaceae bacterium]|nr:Rpn family recombination-promoting nuclease/putative transposase [Clostridiaceae bacterium]